MYGELFMRGEGKLFTWADDKHFIGSSARYA
ncbi:MAG: hypothetical protein ACI9NY_001597 [Kiritimatiellia bacterium]|jgi:hypothetical protein